VRCHVFAVNDASSSPFDMDVDRKIYNYNHIDRIDVIDLACNLGHQRAIAVGLAAVNQTSGIDGVIVMDADGEDSPDDIPRLLASGTDHPGEIVCAQRARRLESSTFVAFYALYKLAFRCLCGVNIDFGNYCFIPQSALRNIVYNPTVWNHLAASIVRSRIPFWRINTRRGPRYAGRSSMNFQSLILHGLSAISVYADLVLVRILIATMVLAAATLVSILGVVAVRLFTELAIPGWATNAVGLLFIMFMQALLIAAVSAFMLLSSRSGKPILPATDALRYIRSRENK
jgi:hypothetical protein